ncbi:MAG TPA: peptidase M23 [Bacteroidales bacterium]|nr:MAG: hypothetical protein A2W98_08225 [Bacteroidetes bacterium GWF2_33_38]OFY69869.1 MAG: hypothetical protein A2265_09005 [Bacteroidetes bacterium RIFOXYA12_FULL_33_9]OFY90616.1 MAG: hypothetical protein A2236_05690 [Bacteroidetes bacterium RIFOXYA2_FULL_33_7]HBF87125.1 peptidase M23 [Bacteroidales bacterium]
MLLKFAIFVFINILFFSNLSAQNQVNINSKLTVFNPDSLKNGHPCENLYQHKWNTEYLWDKELVFGVYNDTTLALDNDSSFVFPYKGKLISPYGPRGKRQHSGVDIKLQLGDSVRCAFDGQVRLAKVVSGYGNVIVVRHYNGLETLYAHLSGFLVKPNEHVKAGEVIGLGGSTGRATTTHLHFETRYLTKAFNPEKILDINSYSLKTESLFVANNRIENDLLLLAEKTNNENDNVIEADDSKNIKYHTISKGDTLYAIARRNNVTVNDLCELNQISKNNILKIGAKIRVK